LTHPEPVATLPILVSEAPSSSLDVPVVGPTDTTAPTPPTTHSRPSDAVVGVVEAVLPVAVPFLGAIPVDDVSAGVAAVFDRLDGMTDPSAESWATPERWAWIGAAVLTAGGAAAAQPRRRRSTVAAPAAGPGLSRWEDSLDPASV
jgi:hypothetical protein